VTDPRRPTGAPVPDLDDASGDALSSLLGRIATMLAAADVEGVLRAAVESSCAATASPRGRAGLFDGEAAISEEWYDARDGWSPGRLRWGLGDGAPGSVCLSGAPAAVTGDDAGPEGRPASAFEGESSACVPVTSAGAVVGFVWVAGRAGGYDAAATQRLAAVARLAAQRLQAVADAERRLAEAQVQADIGERLQRQLLPLQPPRLAGLDIAFEYRSASAGVLSGGDFVDYYTRPPSDSLAFAIGDVAGKGAEAMAHTFVAKFMLRAAVHGGQVSWPTFPGAALQELRTGLLEQPDFGWESERFVTVLFGLISPQRGLLQLSSAGHPPPFIVREATVERPLLLTEPAIGIELGAALEPYPTETIDVRPDDVLVLFTDGIAELRDAGGGFFEDEMAAVLQGCHGRPAAEVIARLLRAAGEFSARPPADDLALLCIRLRREPVN
jgi:serine phosphatase RsbU (regulator of sigma subunit)